MSYFHLLNDLPSLLESWKPLYQRAEDPLKAFLPWKQCQGVLFVWSYLCDARELEEVTHLASWEQLPSQEEVGYRVRRKEGKGNNNPIVFQPQRHESQRFLFS